MTPISEPNFPFQIALRIDWSEMDLFGHVNNVMYFKYIQASRVNYWEQTGIGKDFNSTGIAPILASTKCDFKKPLHYPGSLTIKVRMEFIKTTSFGFEHQLLNENGEIVAIAHDVMVMYDFNKNEKIIFPIELKTEIEKIEGRKF
ncbi:MAG: hypothetical protein RL065_681 [Bacteroidota bacterium]|jgi:acyl-CoA thioester hydrolase